MSGIGTRGAFRIFIRYQLQTMIEDGKVDLTEEELEKFANGIEDDMIFYEELGDFLTEYLENFGTNYGI